MTSNAVRHTTHPRPCTQSLGPMWGLQQPGMLLLSRTDTRLQKRTPCCWRLKHDSMHKSLGNRTLPVIMSARPRLGVTRLLNEDIAYMGCRKSIKNCPSKILSRCIVLFDASPHTTEHLVMLACRVTSGQQCYSYQVPKTTNEKCWRQ